MSRQRFQIAVVGSGFAGSLMAMMARRLGLSTVLIERGRHPRFAIGESSTPLANLLLEEIATEYDLPFVRPLCKWGSWQRQLPQLACGLKRGFTFYHHEFGKQFSTERGSVPRSGQDGRETNGKTESSLSAEVQRITDPRSGRENQLLVGASPNEEIADTHWYRPDFDHYLMTQAQKLGVTYLDEVALTGALEETNGMILTGTQCGKAVEIAAEFVIDATGPRGFLHHALGLSEKTLSNFPTTQGLFSHFENVGVLPDCFSSPGQTPPYPPEQAAVHHVFPGGWMWVLKFNNGITSAGVAVTETLANELNLKEREPAWQRLLQRLPSVAEMFQPARATIPFVYSPRLSFQSETVAGSHWALLPSAAGFVDPLLSTGFPLTLLGVQRMGEVLKERGRSLSAAGDLQEGGSDCSTTSLMAARCGRGIARSPWQDSSLQQRLNDYAEMTTLELEAATRLVGAFYANMDRFEVFKDLSLLYFAAASYSETARRLGKAELADGFLLCRHAKFAKQLREICDAASGILSADAVEKLSRSIREAIEPLDVAGLTDQSRHPWYPALAADMLHNARKVNASEADIRAMLSRCGLV